MSHGDLSVKKKNNTGYMMLIKTTLLNRVHNDFILISSRTGKTNLKWKKIKIVIVSKGGLRPYSRVMVMFCILIKTELHKCMHLSKLIKMVYLRL